MMLKTKSYIKRGMIGTMIAVQVLFFPAFALADHETTHVCPKASGTTNPTGSDAHMFTFNSSTCLWENEYYTWDPVSKVKTNLKAPAIWVYSPAAGAYTDRTPVVPPPVPVAAATTGTTAPTAASGSPTGSSIGNTGPDSNNTIDNNQANDTRVNLDNDVTVTNGITSTATSGNALVQGNTSGGNASTGDAATIANILNMLQSSWDPSNGDITTFSADIYDHYGDLLFDPSAVLNTGPNSQNSINNNQDNQLDINIQNDGRIVNNINLDAQSGNALVSGNTTGGDASTGDATAVVNLFNLINSMIAPGSSFIGTININGSLDGDILLPALLSSIGTTGPDSDNTINNNLANDVNVTSVDNRSITNNTNLGATSGNATVSGNTTGGSASTGDAQTNLNIFNLTGRDIVGNNGLLVFTNVLGQWAGFLFDAPAGSNTVLGTGPGSTNTVNNNAANTLNLDNTNNTSIENNVTATARSGDAAVTSNTTGGDASTGDATVSANIVNLINSQLNFSDWFGVLFINVFGDWNGSFGQDTAAGDHRQPSTKPSTKSSETTRASGTSPRPVAQIFGFVATSSPSGSSGGPTGSSGTTGTTGASVAAATTVADETDDKPTAKQAVSSIASANNNQPAAANTTLKGGLNLKSLTTIGILVAISLLGIERWLAFRDKKQAL